MNNTKNTVALVDDHVVVRSGLKELIESMGNYVVAHEFDNGKELIEHIRSIRFDIIIMDLTMPVMDGEATMKWIKEQDMEVAVLILTLDTSDKTIINLYKSGVRGYLPKTCSAATLKTAIDDIIRTGYYHNELLTDAMKRDSSHKKDVKTEILDSLTDRELHFLRLVCDEEEYTYEQIAGLMHVHRRTVDGYREALFEKFNIKSKTGIVLFAIKHRLLSA